MTEALMKRPKRVLYIDKSTIFGGAEECLLALMQDIDRGRFQPAICFDQPLPHQGPFQQNGFEIYFRIKDKSWWSKDFSQGLPVGLGHLQRFIYATKLWNILIRIRPAIVHLNLYRRTAYLDVNFARRAGALIVAHVRSLASQVPLSPKVLSQCDGIICTSEIVRREVAMFSSGDHVRCIYDGVNCDKYQYHGVREEARNVMNIQHNSFVLASIAMLHPRKGHDMAIRAMPKIVKHNPESILLIAGGEANASRGLEQKRLKDLAHSLGIASHVQFLGHCSDLAALYSASDVILALSTDGEAFGRVPIEAACAQRPIIATALGATPEIIDADVTGALIPAANHEAVAAAVIKLHDNPLARAGLASKASERARFMFSNQKHAENVQTFYDDLIGASQP